MLRTKLETSPMGNIKLEGKVANYANMKSTADLTTASTEAATKRIFQSLLGFDPGPHGSKDWSACADDLSTIYTKFMETDEHDSSSDMFFTHQFHYHPSKCFNRRLFVGASNAFGVGPIDVLPGDSVCILHGSDVHILLRANTGEE